MSQDGFHVAGRRAIIAGKGRETLLARALREYRERCTIDGGKGISRTRLSELLERRWSASAIEKYENSERTPSPEFLHHFARALSLDVKAEHFLVHLRAADAFRESWEDYLEAVEQVNRSKGGDAHA